MTLTAAKMKGLLLTGALILLSVIHSLAADADNTLWNKGNQLYQQREYAAALECFERLAATHPGTAEVYYNLGNTYYKLNKIGPAVLNYERALHVNPDYTEAKENLILTQNRISNHIQATQDIFFINWWQHLTKGSLANMWAVLALATFATIVLIMATNRMKLGSGIRVPAQINGVLTVAFIVMAVLAVSAAQRRSNSNMAVVMQNDAPMMNESLKGKPLSLIPEGTTVKISDTKAGYIEVTLPDGRKGWLQQEQLNKI